VSEQNRPPCGECSVCCIDLVIGDKPAGQKCLNLARPGHCLAYVGRPELCRRYECLWRMLPEIFNIEFRPDFAGVVFTLRQASEFGAPLVNGTDWLVAAAAPCGMWTSICTNPTAMEAVRRLRVNGMAVLLDERNAPGAVVAHPIDLPFRNKPSWMIDRLRETIRQLTGDAEANKDTGDADHG